MKEVWTRLTPARRPPNGGTRYDRSVSTKWWPSWSVPMGCHAETSVAPCSRVNGLHPWPGQPPPRGGVGRTPSSCSTNLNPACQIHLIDQYQRYLWEWRHPAPTHCQEPRPTTGRTSVRVPDVQTDRLGMAKLCVKEG